MAWISYSSDNWSAARHGTLDRSPSRGPHRTAAWEAPVRDDNRVDPLSMDLGQHPPRAGLGQRVRLRLRRLEALCGSCVGNGRRSGRSPECPSRPGAHDVSGRSLPPLASSTPLGLAPQFENWDASLRSPLRWARIQCRSRRRGGPRRPTRVPGQRCAPHSHL